MSNPRQPLSPPPVFQSLTKADGSMHNVWQKWNTGVYNLVNQFLKPFKIGGQDTSAPILVVSSFTTTERNAIQNPSPPMIIYNTTTGKFNYYDSTGWKELP
jgi:hypothetical protein